MVAKIKALLRLKARHLELDFEVAIKVLKPSLSDADSLRRFRQEGVAACRVRHPNAVMVTDFGVTETGVAYLVMELLQGVSLDRELASRGDAAAFAEAFAKSVVRATGSGKPTATVKKTAAVKRTTADERTEAATANTAKLAASRGRIGRLLEKLKHPRGSAN